MWDMTIWNPFKWLLEIEILGFCINKRKLTKGFPLKSREVLSLAESQTLCSCYFVLVAVWWSTHISTNKKKNKHKLTIKVKRLCKFLSSNEESSQHYFYLDSSTWYQKEGDTSRKGQLKNTHQGEASSIKVSTTSRTRRIYNPSFIKEVYKARRSPYIKAPTNKSRLKTYIKLQIFKKNSSPSKSTWRQVEEHQGPGNTSHQFFKEEANPLHLKIYQVHVPLWICINVFL